MIKKVLLLAVVLALQSCLVTTHRVKKIEISKIKNLGASPRGMNGKILLKIRSKPRGIKPSGGIKTTRE